MASLDKAELRSEYRLRIRGLSPEDRARESDDLALRLAAWAEAEGFEVLLATRPLMDEPDLSALFASWLRRGGGLGFPRTSADGTMEYRLVSSMEGPWETRGRLTEPRHEAPRWVEGRPTLCLVPGLAFAWGEGAVRLGRGGGYFDRWLARHGREVFSLGVGFSVSSCDSLPLDPWDQKLDGLALAGQPLRR